MTAASADLTKLSRNLAAAQGMSIQNAVDEVLHVYAEKVKATAQALAPVKTGALQRSIEVGYEPNKATIGPHVTYGVYQEFGTGERGEFPTGKYPITPKQSEFLVFRVNGRIVRTRRVMHPGVRPHPYMRPAVQQVLGDMAEELAQRGALLITRGPNA